MGKTSKPTYIITDTECFEFFQEERDKGHIVICMPELDDADAIFARKASHFPKGLERLKAEAIKGVRARKYPSKKETKGEEQNKIDASPIARTLISGITTLF